MKLIKLEVYIVDFDEFDNLKTYIDIIQDQNYPCAIYPRVLNADIADIGEWSDGHHLNMTDATLEEYRKYFKNNVDNSNKEAF